MLVCVKGGREREREREDRERERQRAKSRLKAQLMALTGDVYLFSLPSLLFLLVYYLFFLYKLSVSAWRVSYAGNLGRR